MESVIVVGDQVRVRFGLGGFRPCAGWVGEVVAVPEVQQERYGFAVRFSLRHYASSAIASIISFPMTLNYHREEIERHPALPPESPQ